MKTKLYSALCVAVLAAACPAGAQTNWGNALALDGVDDYVAVPSGIWFSNEFTIEVWVYERSYNDWSRVIDFGNGAPSENVIFALSRGTTGTPCLQVYPSGQFVSPAAPLPLNQWVHLAATLRSNTAIIYVNGVAVATNTVTAPNAVNRVNNYIGRSNWGADAYPNARLDDLRIWSVARTADEIRDDRWHPLSGTESNLVAYYRFDESTGIKACDATPNHRDGTLINRPVRAPSLWSPAVTLNSPDPLTNECHVAFADPTTVNASLLRFAMRDYHSLALRADGTIAGWGAGGPGVSEWPHYGQTTIPANATNVVAIAAGCLYSLALKADGTVIGLGASFSGVTNIPAGALNVVAIAAGYDHNLALKANGTVVGWGANWGGETTIPAGAVNVVAIAAGDGHSLALKADGTVLGWGNNNSGQTTIPARATNVVAIAAGNYHSLALRGDGTVVAWGDNYSGQTDIPPAATNVVAIAAGAYHNLALKADGTVVGWGYYGTQDVPPEATNVMAIAAGAYYSVALRVDGTAVGWGGNYWDQTAIPSSVSQLSLPLAVTGAVNTNALGTYPLTYHTTNVLGAVGTAARTVIVADTRPPTVTLRGSNPLMVSRDSPFVDPGATAADLCTGDLTASIATNVTVNTSIPGVYTNTFIVADASGNVGYATRTVVVAAPIVSTLPASGMLNGEATLNGTVNPNAAETLAWFEWGPAYQPDYAYSTPPQIMGSGTTAQPISSALRGLTPGIIYRCRLVAANSPWVARANEQVFWSPAIDLHGPDFLTLELGTPFVETTAVHAFPLAIAAGYIHSLALKADGRVVGWGNNSYGRTNAPAAATNIVAIAAGGMHSLGLRSDGRVIGWGYNYYGQTNAPANATNVVAIAAGFYHNLALKTDRTVVGWGNNSAGQTNRPASVTNVVAIAAGNDFSLALRADGTVVGWGYNQHGEATGVPNTTGYASTGLVMVAGQTLTNVVAIAAGYYHSLALKADGSVVGWGAGAFVAEPDTGDYENYGQIMIPDSATNVVTIAAGGFHNLALRADGTVLGWGDNYSGEVTVPDGLSNVVAIAAGGGAADGSNVGHSLALKADGTVVGWGAGGPGNSSYPNFGQSTIPPGLDTLNLPLAISGTVNTNVLGTYVLNYSATNALGAVGTARRTVVIATRPLVTTEPATQLSPAGATLNGTANPRASQTFAWFEYGLGANYGSQTQQMPVGNSTNAQPVASRPSDLLPWMTYHFRAVASNDLGRTDGPDATFTIPGPSLATPSLSALPDLTLPQGGSTSVWFTVSPPGLEVQVRSSNPVLLPDDGLTLTGSGSSRHLTLAPALNHSGSARVTVLATDGSRSASGTFTLIVTPSGGYAVSSLYLTNMQLVSPQAWRFRLVDAGTGTTNYAVEYRAGLASTNAWMPATNVTALGGGVFEVAAGPPHPRLGFYRAKGFRLLVAGFDSSVVTVEEGANTPGPVLVFNGVYAGTVTCIWTDQHGTSWTNQVQVNGTTAAVPLPASSLGDDAGIGQLQSLTLRLEEGPGFILGPTTESTLNLEENDACWRGVLQTISGPLGFRLIRLQTNGTTLGQIQSEGFGFFPTNALVQLNLTEQAFTAAATNIPLPVLTASPSSTFTNYLDLRLDAANAPGATNVTPARIQGRATLVSTVPDRPYLDTAVSGTFELWKQPTASSTNEVPLSTVP